MANIGDVFEVNLLNSVDVDKTKKDIYSFGDQAAPHNANTGIERNGGIQNIYEQETVFVGTGNRYVTEDANLISIEDIAATDLRNVNVNGSSVGVISKYGVQSRVSLDGYADAALSVDGTIIAINIDETTVTITELSLIGVALNSRTVSFSGLVGLLVYFSSLSLVRYQTMQYVDSQEFALRMADNVVILKESTPTQFVPVGVGSGAAQLFPGGGNLATIGTYRGYIIFGSSAGKISSFDGVNFRFSNGTGIGVGPFNNQTAVGTDNITSVIEYSPSVDEHYLVVTGGPNSRVGSWDGVAWKNYDATGAGDGPFNNGTAIPAGVPSGIFGSVIYTFNSITYYVIRGILGRVASWSAGAWKNYDGTGTGAGPFDNGTAIGTNVIRDAIQYSTRLVVVGDGGRVGSWSGTAWTVYTAGSGLSNNATVVGAQNILSTKVYNNTILFVASSGGRVGTWDGTNWRNYDGTGTGTGPSSNSVVVGTDQIQAMALLGTTIVIFGFSNSRMGSWDGTNFKNYDGTGTGTGIFSAAIPDAPNPIFAVSGAFNGKNVIVFGGISAYTYVDGANNFGPLYRDSTGVLSTAVSRILQTSSLAGYLYVYRYENAQYLMMVTANTTNKAFLVDPSATPKLSRSLNGRYAMPQVSGGFTRHIVIETPRIDTVPAVDTIRTLSLVGYTNFVTFSTVQVYPENDSANVNAINISGIGPAIGFNYADVTYRTTASGTDIWDLYLPNPTPTAIKFNRLIQCNTATNVNGYGKLNNMVGLPTTKPFEFRNIMINTQQSALSVAMIDGLPTDAVGALLTNIGEWDDSHTPMIELDDTLLYRFDNKFVIVKIGTVLDTNTVVQKINKDLYKLNTIHPSNLYSDIDKTLNVGSLDYNGRVFFTSTAAPSTTVFEASVIAGKYSNSIDVDDKATQINPMTSANIEVFGYRLPAQGSVSDTYFVDTYIDDEYSFSTPNDGTEISRPELVDTVYLPKDTVPIALLASYFGNTAVIGDTTIILQPNYDGYVFGNDIAGSYVGFRLYGQNYLFDGNFIYLASIDQASNVLIGVEQLSPADGVTLIAATPNMVFFLSDFDNSLYVFQGGRDLNKYKRFTATTAIRQGVWSVRDNTLVLETQDGFVWIRDDLVTQNTKKASQSTVRMYETTEGLYIMTDAAQWRYTYLPIAGSTVVPLRLRTAFFGLNANYVSILRSFVIVIYNADRHAVTVDLLIDSYDQDSSYHQTVHQVINPSDYNDFGYARIRIQPQYQNSLGIAIQYDSDEFALIQEINILYDGNAQATIKEALSK
jgi:hypothetical protein